MFLKENYNKFECFYFSNLIVDIVLVGFLLVDTGIGVTLTWTRGVRHNNPLTLDTRTTGQGYKCPCL